MGDDNSVPRQAGESYSLGCQPDKISSRFGRVLALSPGLKSYLQQLTQLRSPILHLHGVWMGFQWVAARVALAQKVPVLLSPHGMLNRWHLRHLGFKELRKLIYWRTVAYPAFRHIPLIHAVTLREADDWPRGYPGKG